MQYLSPRPLLPPPLVAQRAVARWHASQYDATMDALTDLSGNGLHARFGSAVGADTNDPLRLVYEGTPYVYLPGVAGNNLSVGVVDGAYDYVVTYEDTTTASGTVMASGGEAVMGDAEANFAGKRIAEVVLSQSSVVKARFAAAGATQTGYSDGDYGTVWTVNRSAAGRRTVVMDGSVPALLLLGTDDHLVSANHPLFNVGAGQAVTAVVVVRQSAVTTAFRPYIAKLGSGVAGDVGWRVEPHNTAEGMLYLVRDDTTSGDFVGPPRPLNVLVMCGVMRNAAGQVKGFVGDQIGTGPQIVSGSLTAPSDVVMGKRSDLSRPCDFEFIAAAIFREALSTTDLARLAAELGVPS